MSSPGTTHEVGAVLSGRCWPQRCSWPLALLGAAGAARRSFRRRLDVERGMAELVRKGLLWRYVLRFLAPRGIGYLSAVALGIPPDLLLGWYPAAASVVNPVIQILRPISPIAWIPVAIVWFGVGDLAAIFLIFLASLFPDRGRHDERRAQRAVDVPPRGTQFRAFARRSFLRESSFRPRCRRSSSDCGSRSASPGWSWWRRR